MARGVTALFLILSGCAWRSSTTSQRPGVTQEYKTFCRNDKIPMNLSCDNSFIIKNDVFARVVGTHVTDSWPFQFIGADGTMQILDDRNFTHRSLCRLHGNLEEEVFTHYHHTPGSNQNGASSAQGLLLLTLIIAAFVYMMVF